MVLSHRSGISLHTSRRQSSLQLLGKLVASLSVRMPAILMRADVLSVLHELLDLNLRSPKPWRTLAAGNCKQWLKSRHSLWRVLLEVPVSHSQNLVMSWEAFMGWKLWGSYAAGLPCRSSGSKPATPTQVPVPVPTKLLNLIEFKCQTKSCRCHLAKCLHSLQLVRAPSGYLCWRRTGKIPLKSWFPFE